MLSKHILLTTLATGLARCAVVPKPLGPALSNTSYGPQPGQDQSYSEYRGVRPPFPANIRGAISNTTAGDPGPDDLLFQNLLQAEWIIFSFYQQGVEHYNASAFVEAGYPNTTYDRIQEIRDNEAGHLRIFQDQISTNSVKPGPCQYKYPVFDPKSWVELQTLIEVASLAFLTGLVNQAKLPISRAAMVAIAATESRHNTWSLMSNWNASPFAGPTDTIYPYANEILDYTNEWVVPGSCPPENTIFPTPRQNLPQITPGKGTKSIEPGSTMVFNFTTIAGELTKPNFMTGKEYYAVFFHALYNISVPFDTTALSAVIPKEIEPRGITLVVVADEEGAPTRDNVLAGPLVLPMSPLALAMLVGGSY